MKLCDKCFSMVDPDAAFCAECGAPTGEAREETSDALVYPEIARANLLRMRGEHIEAEKICLAVLKRFPNNPTSHILMGDIHTEQGNLEQAKQWYEMAFEITPENTSLKKKLERVNESLERENRVVASAGLEVNPPGKGLVTAYAIIGVVLIVLIGGAFWLGWLRANAGVDKRLQAVEPISINGTAPQAVPENDASVPENTPPQESAQTPLSNGMTADESSLLSSVASQLGALGSRIVAITLDPRTGNALVTVNGREGATPSDDAIEAASVGVALLAKSAAMQRAEVRLLDPAVRRVRFLGAVTQQTMQAASGEPGSFQWAASVLADASPPISGTGSSG